MKMTKLTRTSVYLLTAVSASCGILTTVVQAQPSSSAFQPYTPPVVGGLPPNSKNLEQPVYVADRGLSADTDFSEPIITAEEMGFNATSSIPSLQEMTAFEAGTVIAAVGVDRVTIGDLVPANKINPELLNHPQFEMMIRKELVEAVTRKAMAQHFLNDKAGGKSPKEQAQAKKHIETQTTKIFFQKWVPMQKERMKCVSDLDLWEKLAAMGKSEQSMLHDFKESTWAQEHMRENVNEKPAVELSEIHDYYVDHIDSFKRPAKSRFQIMSAVFSKHPTKEAAYQSIAEMWNEVFTGGAPFEAVAKRRSSGLRAEQGGQMDWLTQGALKSKAIDKAIFENPVRGLSQIIEDEDGYHFLEVLERKESFTVLFAEAQGDIRKTIVKEKISKNRLDFIKKVREKTPVWTKWPADIPGSQDLALIQ
jgi:hypothetical protein